MLLTRILFPDGHKDVVKVCQKGRLFASRYNKPEALELFIRNLSEVRCGFDSDAIPHTVTHSFPLSPPLPLSGGLSCSLLRR
jgi:hypothetical protein